MFKLKNAKTLDKILLKKFNHVVLNENDIKQSKSHTIENKDVLTVLDVIYELKQNGYVLDKQLVQYLLNSDTKQRNTFINQLFRSTQSDMYNISGHVFFKDFPKFKGNNWRLHQLVHYLTVYNDIKINGEHYLPRFHGDEIVKGNAERKQTFYIGLNESEYDKLLNNKNLKTTSYVTNYDEIFEYVDNLLNSKTSLSEDNMNDLVELLSIIYGENSDVSDEQKQQLIPEKIERKETLAHVFVELMNNGVSIDELKYLIHTTTDVLRVLDVMFDGNGTLKDGLNSKLIKLNRKLRLNIMTLLNNVGSAHNIAEDMFRNKSTWKGLMKIIHPFEKRYNHLENVQRAFKLLIDDDKSFTFNARVKELEKKKDIESLELLLVERPGEYARRIVFILRNLENPMNKEFVIKRFSTSIVQDVSSLVLYQLLHHLINEDLEIRKVETKRGVHYRMNDTKHISKKELSLLKLVITGELMTRYAQLEDMGKVYIDESLTQYNVPIAQRTSSLATTLMTRGSQIKIDLKDTLRLFTYWENTDLPNVLTNRIDVDLSAALIDENYEIVDEVTYYNQRVKGASLSGDITDAPDGANEFIDLNIKALRDRNIRYVLTYVNVYAGLPFSEFTCKSGWLNLDKDELDLEFNTEGKVHFNGEDVENIFDISSNHTRVTPMLVDIKNGRIHWLDETIATRNEYQQNLSLLLKREVEHEGTHKTLGEMIIKRTIEQSYLPIYAILELHVATRNGTLVDDKSEADIVFDESTLNVEEIMSKYL